MIRMGTAQGFGNRGSLSLARAVNAGMSRNVVIVLMEFLMGNDGLFMDLML